MGEIPGSWCSSPSPGTQTCYHHFTAAQILEKVIIQYGYYCAIYVVDIAKVLDGTYLRKTSPMPSTSSGVILL